MQQEVRPRPAATTMLLRPNPGGFEVFMARRNSQSSNLPDVYVFPGGAVDTSDSGNAVTARLAGREKHGDLAPFAVAAIRELFEEAGVLLAHERDGSPLDLDTDPSRRDQLLTARAETYAGRRTFLEVIELLSLNLDGNALVRFSHWITPLALPRRFDTHFFVAAAPEGQHAIADAVELHDGIWSTPADALLMFERGEIALIFPTIKHLERLTRFATVDDVISAARSAPIETILPDLDDEGRIVFAHATTW